MLTHLTLNIKLTEKVVGNISIASHLFRKVAEVSYKSAKKEHWNAGLEIWENVDEEIQWGVQRPVENQLSEDMEK